MNIVGAKDCMNETTKNRDCCCCSCNKHSSNNFEVCRVGSHSHRVWSLVEHKSGSVTVTQAPLSWERRIKIEGFVEG